MTLLDHLLHSNKWVSWCFEQEIGEFVPMDDHWPQIVGRRQSPTHLGSDHFSASLSMCLVRNKKKTPRCFGAVVMYYNAAFSSDS